MDVLTLLLPPHPVSMLFSIPRDSSGHLRNRFGVQYPIDKGATGPDWALEMIVSFCWKMTRIGSWN